MVIFEAVRAIINLNQVTSRELQPAITVLQLFLSSSKPTLRFAAIRALNKVAMLHPAALNSCNIEMEGLISDHNRSIATLAITTLLKTGNESSIDRLLKQIMSFMADIQDEFKVVVVESIRSLSLKFPQKHRVLMNFLSSILREEGGFEYKKSIVDCILSIVQEIPDAKDAGLAQLSEFIEDCEFTYLSSQILHILGQQGPLTSDPSKYIRYIYNRVILENATIRASAVSALAKFGSLCPGLLPHILQLLRRCLYDNDDEVRDRAAFCLSSLQKRSSRDSTNYENEKPYSIASMESALFRYLDVSNEVAFDVSAIERTEASPFAFGCEDSALANQAHRGISPSIDQDILNSQESVLNLPEFVKFGPIFKSCPTIELTEAETEYKVTCTKHIFEKYVAFQYQCTNTIEEQILEDVSVVMDLIEGEDCFAQIASVELKSMPLGTSGSTFVAFQRDENAFSSAKFACTLRFTSKEVDPASGQAEEDGYEDEYTLEDIELSPLDFMKASPLAHFRTVWDALPTESERVDDYGLGIRKSLDEAVDAVMLTLGLQPCEGTDVVPPGARSHTTLLSGLFVGDIPILIQMKLGIDSSGDVAMKLTVRAEEIVLSELVHTLVSEA